MTLKLSLTCHSQAWSAKSCEDLPWTIPQTSLLLHTPCYYCGAEGAAAARTDAAAARTAAAVVAAAVVAAAVAVDAVAVVVVADAAVVDTVVAVATTPSVSEQFVPYAGRAD